MNWYTFLDLIWNKLVIDLEFSIIITGCSFSDAVVLASTYLGILGKYYLNQQVYFGSSVINYSESRRDFHFSDLSILLHI